MAKFVTGKEATSISVAAAIALLLSGLGIAVWHGMGAGWRHEEATPQQLSLSLRLLSLMGTSAASAGDSQAAGTAAAAGDAHAAAAAGSSSADGVAADASVGPGGDGAGLERFRLPSQASYDKLQADPGALDGSPELAAEFEAAPWLLPPRTTALPYAGVTGFDALLELRAAEVPGLNTSKAVSFLTSTLHDPLTTALTQNCIYSLVKFAGVTNYIVAVWTEEALGACADLNLPCTDIRPLVEARGLPEEKQRGQFVTWTRHIVAERVLEKGLAMHFMDMDLAYAAKPLWLSYMTILHDPPADAAFMNEEAGIGPLNTGNFVVMPTPKGREFIQRMLEGLIEYVGKDTAEQIWINNKLAHQQVFQLCRNRQQCYRILDENEKENRTGRLVLIRTYQPPYWSYSNHDFCAMAQPWAPSLDLCDWNILYFHAYCNHPEEKVRMLRDQALWFMDVDPDAGWCARRLGSELHGAVECRPLVWREPKLELPVTRCAGGLAWHHERPSFDRRMLRWRGAG